MKKYIKNYLKAYWLDETDFVECEVCWRAAQNFHHIILRSQWWSDDASNLIALCQENCHRQAHFLKEPYLTADELFELKKVK